MAEPSPRDPQDPLDEEAAWAEIVAGYGEEPRIPAWDDAADEPDREGRAGEDGGAPAGPAASSGPAGLPGAPDLTKPDPAKPAADARPEGLGEIQERPRRGPGAPGGGSAGSFVVYAPGVGPRDWDAAQPSDDDFDDGDEGHFTPPEPPPLPHADVTARFAWLAVLGGPLLLLVMVLIQQPMTWWITVLGVGGFLGGFGTLVARMKSDDEDDDGPAPGSGAVV
ncbi:hypothetical protein [Streptomyces pinistramenti]|uniref:hypothetical protein n=1 Tax=Streptomyces pinistramenti TaxID=2884812 RepID=UPI001D07292A|nr:hypothetical protein [Streptomyces pinistramenti]MCB5910665.1 hypothetical protein [Streptomyces pinistramenti]